MRFPPSFYFMLMLAAAIAAGGCAGRRVPEESAAREHLQSVTATYRPGGVRPALSELGTDPTLDSLLRFAIANSPAVEAAYFDWWASIERITTARSPEDPRFTFEADIQEAVRSLVPGLMFILPTGGKLRARAAKASAESEILFARFRVAVVESAAAVKRVYYELRALEGFIEVSRRMSAVVGDLEAIATAQHAAGKVTLQDVLRAQIERDRLETRLESYRDAREAAAARFRGALGLSPGDTTLPVPRKFSSSAGEPPGDILEIGLRESPRLAEMASEITAARTAIETARLGRAPVLELGFEADVKPSPFVFTPEISLSLPLWRDRIAAEIAGAEAGAHGAEARLEHERISLAVAFASAMYLYRESRRNIQLYEHKLLPKARRSVEVARAGYIGGQSSFIDFLDAERTLLEFEIDSVRSQKERELALAELSLAIAGSFPAEWAMPARREGQSSHMESQ